MNPRSSSGKAPVWIGIVAVLVIAAAGFMIVRQSRSGESQGGDPRELVIICAECGHQFSMSGEDYAEQLAASPNHLGVRCPQCGKYAARVASKCVNPDCGRYYLRPGPDGRGSSKCPYCGTPRTGVE